MCYLRAAGSPGRRGGSAGRDDLRRVLRSDLAGGVTDAGVQEPERPERGALADGRVAGRARAARAYRLPGEDAGDGGDGVGYRSVAAAETVGSSAQRYRPEP